MRAKTIEDDAHITLGWGEWSAFIRKHAHPCESEWHIGFIEKRDAFLLRQFGISHIKHNFDEWTIHFCSADHMTIFMLAYL